MKILMVCPDWFPHSEGLAKSCLRICKKLKGKNHEVKLVVADQGELDPKGMDITPLKSLFRLLGRNPYVPFIWPKIKELIKWADAVCIFSYMYEINSRIVWYKRIGKINKPVVHFYRGSLEKNSVQHLSPATQIGKWLYDHTCGKNIFQNADLNISNSEQALNTIRQMYGKVNSKYIPTAIDVNNYPQWKKENKQIVFVGRLVENKGVKLFEKISKNIPKDWTFAIIGDGPLRKDVIELSKKYSHVKYIGKQNHDQTKRIMASSDILILPSFAEGSPRVVIEAAAIGIPSISFAVGDVPNTIPKGTGYSIKCFDDSDFVKRLKELIKNKSLREKMGKNAHKFAKTVLDWKTILPQIEESIQSLIKDQK